MSHALKPKPRTFAQKQAHWYERLKDSGFSDIEETKIPGRPLKRYHSFDLLDERHQAARIQAAEYQARCETFFHGPNFREVCRILSSHGNNALSADKLSRLFELHLEGKSQRQIARELRQSKSCVQECLTKLKAWMRLL